MGAPTACKDYTASELRKKLKCTVNGGQVTFTVPQDACQEEISFSTYELPTGAIRPFDKQVLYRNTTATYGPGTYNLTLDLPPMCGYQSDLYVGAELATLDKNCGHCGRILCYDVKADPSCASN